MSNLSSKCRAFTDTLYLRNILNDQLKVMANLQQSTPDDKMFYAEYLFKMCNNTFYAQDYLNRANLSMLTAYQKFKMFVLKKVIKNTINPNEVGNPKYNFIEKVIKTERVMKEIKLEMKSVLKKSAEFWRDFRDFNNKEFGMFKGILEEIINTKYAIRDKWKYLEKYLRYNSKYMLYWRWFLKDFLNRDITVNEELVNAMAIEHENLQSNGLEDFDDSITLNRKPFYSDTFIAHIRMDLQNPGEIISVSRSCFSFTGYSHQELLHQKINKLMPKTIADGHDAVLHQFIHVGITFTNNKISTFMKMKDGSIKAVNLLIKLYYKMNSNLQMVGLFREVHSRVENLDYILTEHNGVGYSFSLPAYQRHDSQPGSRTWHCLEHVPADRIQHNGLHSRPEELLFEQYQQSRR
jgi:PAS domain S-box-containing protein